MSNTHSDSRNKPAILARAGPRKLASAVEGVSMCEVQGFSQALAEAVLSAPPG